MILYLLNLKRKHITLTGIKLLIISPYQLSVLPDSDYYKNHIKDLPKDSDISNFKLEKGDIIIMATDGLFDNLFEKDIINIVKNNSEKNTKIISQMLVDSAYVNSINQKFNSPFTVNAKSHGLNYLGGKIDDITVLIGKVE
jgi:protein phosphatase PTC7